MQANNINGALASIKSKLPYEERIRLLISAKAAGIDYETAKTWWFSQTIGETQQQFKSKWKSIDVNGKIGHSTLFYYAKKNGWSPSVNAVIQMVDMMERAKHSKETEEDYTEEYEATRQIAMQLSKHFYQMSKQGLEIDPSLSQYLIKKQYHKLNDTYARYNSDIRLKIFNKSDLPKNIKGASSIFRKMEDGPIICLPLVSMSLDKGKTPVGYQFIDNNGLKRFLFGKMYPDRVWISNPKLLDESSAPVMAIAEGFMTAFTAKSIIEHVTQTSAVAFASFGIASMKKVVKSLLRAKININLVIADLDDELEPHPVSKQVASMTKKAKLIYPLSAEKSDVNDIFCADESQCISLFKKAC